jgi:hypothetical protein
MSLRDEIQAEQRIAELEKTAQTLQRQLAAAKSKDAELVGAVERAARDAALITGQAKPRKPAKKKSGKGSAERALLHLTDWQLGKATESYDTTVAQVRVRKCVEKVLRLTEIQRAAHPVDEITVMLGGDMVEGITVFPGNAYEVDSTTFEQVFAAAHVLEESLLTLAEHFSVVHVHSVNGNHGRIGRRGDNPRGDNWDRVLYRIVRDKIAGGGGARIVWDDPVSWYDIVEVGAYRALLVHGDQVKSFGGNTPAFGIMRKSTAWSSGVTESFDDVYLGHFHSVMTLQLPNGGRVFMTPSLESGSEYAREFVAARGRPAQRLHYVDPTRGRVTAEYVLWLD